MRHNRHPMLLGIFTRLVALCLGSGASGVVLAQDLKPISTTLAAGIATSGRKTVAVVDFTDLEGNATRLGRFLAEEVSVDLVAQAKDFDVIDRTHLKVILEEHRLSATGLIDPATARKLGQIAGADALLTGTMTPLGDSIRLNLKVLDTQTAKMLTAASTDIPKTPAITALLTDQNAPSSATPPLSPGSSPASDTQPPSAQITAEQSELSFAIRKCQRGGSTLTCSGYITNESEKRRLVNPIGNGPPLLSTNLETNMPDATTDSASAAVPPAKNSSLICPSISRSPSKRSIQPQPGRL
jgi:TolB-like protein